MFIKQLELKNFRNYEELDISFNSDKVLFIGKNAQGKTNILEAVYYLSCLNSFRAKTDAELIKWGTDACAVCVQLQNQDIDINLNVQLRRNAGKKTAVNGVNKNKMSEFIRHISCVCFTSHDLLLLRGSPEDRRRRLDAAICSIFPAYIERLSKYNKIKMQKNNYLKSLKNSINADASMLDIWNEQLAVTGSNIIFIRINFLHELQKAAQIKHRQISNSENLTMIYNSSIIGDISAVQKFEHNAEYILEHFLKSLEEKKQEEIIRAQSITGPHRDDISFFINGTDAETYASQGQQRTIVLSLKLARLDLIREKTGQEAVLLLDDVLAELDDLRQNFLLEAIGASQTIITSVDTLHFQEKYIKDAEIFEIKDGAVSRLINPDT